MALSRLLCHAQTPESGRRVAYRQENWKKGSQERYFQCNDRIDRDLDGMGREYVQVHPENSQFARTCCQSPGDTG
jgi:hypothetical protein